MKMIIVVSSMVWSSVLLAQISQQDDNYVTEIVTGVGVTQQTALQNGLASALSRHYGLQLVEAEAMTSQFSTDSTTVSKVNEVQHAANTTVKKGTTTEVSTLTEGRIRRYVVLSNTQKPDTQMWEVELSVDIPKIYKRGFNPDTRRRMVVLPFTVLQDTATIYGKPFRVVQLSGRMEERLNECLTQTRKFTMLDRRFEAETTKELARLRLGNASPDDMARIGQLLVTDYLLVGTFRVLEQPQSTTNPYTGSVTTPDASLLEIHYRVLLAPTGQLKWSNTLMVPASYAGGATTDEYVSGIVDAAAQLVERDVMSNIYPYRVAAKQDGLLVLNQGGKGISEGEVMDVFVAGKMVVDPVTGEELGETEKLVGRVRIVRVEAKMSFAEIVEGKFDEVPVDSIVRRPKFTMSAEPQASGAPSDTKVTPGGGVIPPWKK